MADSRDLKRAAKKQASGPRMPDIRVSSPQVQVPVTVKMDELTAEVSALSTAMVQLAKQQEAILKAIQEQTQVLGVLAQRDVKIAAPEVTVEGPTVKIPPRPDDFEVEFIKNGSDTVGMRLHAVK